MVLLLLLLLLILGICIVGGRCHLYRQTMGGAGRGSSPRECRGAGGINLGHRRHALGLVHYGFKLQNPIFAKQRLGRDSASRGNARPRKLQDMYLRMRWNS